MNLPKISLITPSFNHANFLEDTILSVITQGYPNLEHIVVDGGSTDGSVDIIRKYQDRLAWSVSEPDNGMYDALQKGFARSTGDIMGWINSDDMLHKNSLFTIAELLTLPGVRWIQGTSTMFDENGRTVRVGNSGGWSPFRHLSDPGCIQQESTYWTRELWNEAGGYISTDYKLASDYELWGRFFKHAKLFTPECLIGGFRMRKAGNNSMAGNHYTLERNKIESEILRDKMLAEGLKTLQQLETLKKVAQKSRVFNWHFLTNRIDNKMKSIHDYPQSIFFNRESQKFEIKG